MPGDTVFVKEGIYQPEPDGLNMQRSGTSESPIVFMAYQGDLPVIEFSNSSLPERGWDWHGFKDYLEIHGFEIIRSRWAIVIQGNYNKIVNCKISETGGDGLSIWGGSYNLISNNEVTQTEWNGISLESRPDEGEKGKCNFNIIEYNRSYKNSLHAGINIFPNTLQRQDSLIGNIIRYNTINNNKGGIYLRRFKDGEIYGNLIYDNYQSGIFLHLKSESNPDPPYPFPANLKIYNNTLINNTFYFSINNYAFSGVDIKNNIIIQHNEFPPVRTRFTSDISMDHNLYFNTVSPYAASWGDTSNYTLSQLNIIGQELNGIDSNAFLAADHKQTGISPVIDNGLDLGAPYDYDMDGNMRGAGSGWDIGAFESQSENVAKLYSKIYLEGPYENGQMRTDLNTLNLIPLLQPYGSDPWDYNEHESVTIVPTDITDWILVEVRIDSKIISRKVGFIRNDGMIVDIDGVSHLHHYNITDGRYHIAIYHRNHLPIMSAFEVEINDNPELYDFTLSNSQALGPDPMIELSSGVFGLIAGDTNNSGIITAADKISINSNFLTQDYLKADTNLSGTVNQEDKDPILSNNLKQEYIP